MPNINRAVKFMIDTANDNMHGYDQTHRNGPDYDCSSLVGTALHEAGFNVSPYSWTGNLESQLRRCGFMDCGRPWKAGDIHLSTFHHVCMSVNEKQIAHASINELGSVSGGLTGDQTGKEICIRDYYEYKHGWDVHLRYVGINMLPDENERLSLGTVARQVIAGNWGDGETRKQRLELEGYDYEEVQYLVNSLLSGGAKKSTDEIAREVLRGDWGNGIVRRERLSKKGYDYTVIQNRVNQMLGW